MAHCRQRVIAYSVRGQRSVLEDVTRTPKTSYTPVWSNGSCFFCKSHTHTHTHEPIQQLKCMLWWKTVLLLRKRKSVATGIWWWWCNFQIHSSEPMHGWCQCLLYGRGPSNRWQTQTSSTVCGVEIGKCSKIVDGPLYIWAYTTIKMTPCVEREREVLTLQRIKGNPIYFIGPSRA